MATISRINRLLSSIRWRFIIIYLLIIIAAFGLVTLLTSRIIEDSLLNQRVSESMQQVNDFSVNVAEVYSTSNAQTLYEQCLEQGRTWSGRVLIVNDMGIVQVDSFAALNGVQLELREVTQVLTGQKDAAVGYHKVGGQTGGSMWAAYYASAIVENTDTIGAVVFSESIQDVVNKTDQIKIQYLFIFFIAIILILLSSYFSTNHISRPLEQLRESAIEISRGNFHQRVKVQGKSEIAELGNAFNQMSEKLENVDKQRSEFVSNASHELKTPMTSMKILIESLLYQDGIDESVYKEFLGDMNQEIDRLTQLINDLLLMTKIESDKEKLNVEGASIVYITKKVVESLTPIAKEKDIDLNFTYEEDQPCYVNPSRIRQAITNLVDNAVKYTPSGGKVNVWVEFTGGEVVVGVQDTGEGIGEEHLEHIFERFYRVDKARSRETGGTGLGLHIVKRIALMHGGQVEVKSVVGEGSTFKLRIPFKPVEEEE